MSDNDKITIEDIYVRVTTPGEKADIVVFPSGEQFRLVGQRLNGELFSVSIDRCQKERAV